MANRPKLTEKIKESMAEGQPGHSSKAQSVTTAARWYQSKRVPLYGAVAVGFVGASLYLFGNRTQHPQVEGSKIRRKDELVEEQPGADAAGKSQFESSGRQMSRQAGFHEGQKTDGIFPNTKIAKKIGEIMPGGDSEPKAPKP